MTDSQSYPPPPPDPSGYGQQYGGQQYGDQGYGTQPGYGTPVGYGATAPIPYASWIQRVGGYLVDMLVLIPGYLVVMIGAFMAPAMMDTTPGPNGEIDAGLSGAAVAVMLLGYAAVIGLHIWNRYIRMGRTGWSIGKQVVGIRLISESTGQPMGAGMAFVRDLAHVLDSLACYLGWLWPLWDQKRQTFADKLLTTVVIQQRRD